MDEACGSSKSLIHCPFRSIIFQFQVIEPSELLYAVGQGALAVECRVNDAFVLDFLSQLCDFKTQCRILVERSFLKTLGGGCSAPVGINSVITETGQEFTLEVDGGVWSLNGKTEIVDHVSSKFVMESGKTKADDDDDDNEVDVTPTKRQKLSEEDSEKLKKSPEIIDESPCSTMGGKDAAELVNIHGKVFDVCPFSGKSKVDQEAKNETVPADSPVTRKFDPQRMPIGQDFMGECPVLSTEQKITFDTKAGGDGLICPVAGQFFVSPNVTSEEIDKCPFLHKQHETVELIDYEANLIAKPKSDPKSLIDNVGDVKLYCGFFCHNESLRPIFDKCEALGISLAEKLISAGALEVMKVAQDEIHSKC